MGCTGLQTGAPAEEDLKSWGHHTHPATLPDAIMRSIGAELPGIISFVFTNEVRWHQSGLASGQIC